MTDSIFSCNAPFSHSQHEFFAHIELLRLWHQHNCMGWWKVSLLLSRELFYIDSHCATLCPQYFSPGSVLVSASLHLSVVFILLPILFPHQGQINYFKRIFDTSGLSTIERNDEVVLYIHSLKAYSITHKNFGIFRISPREYNEIR